MRDSAPFAVGMLPDGTLAIIIGDGDIMLEVSPELCREIAAGMYQAAAAAEHFRASRNN